MGRPVTKFPALVPVDLDGVVIGNHALTVHAQRFERIVGMVGKRLYHWLKVTTAEQSLPTPEWTEAFRYYQSALLNLLREQRERYRLTLGDQVSPEQLEAQFREQLVRALSSFTPDERAFTLQLWEANRIPSSTTETPQ